MIKQFVFQIKLLCVLKSKIKLLQICIGSYNSVEVHMINTLFIMFLIVKLKKNVFTRY